MRRAWKHSNTGRMLLVAAVAAVCLAQPTNVPDHTAKVVSMYGRVSVISGGNPERALFEGNLVRPTQMIVTGPDGWAQFQVSDGSTFEVFPDSKLVFREHQTNLTDLLNLIIGRVKVKIEHLNGQPNPNRVDSPTAIISVRGTQFDVKVEDDDGTTLVSVEEGLVDVQNKTAAGNRVFVGPGESLRVFLNQPLAKQQIDKGGILQKGLRALADVWYRIMINRGGPTGGPLPGSTIPTGGGANGDKGKGGGTTPTTPGAPGAPGAPAGTTAPGAPGPPH